MIRSTHVILMTCVLSLSTTSLAARFTGGSAQPLATSGGIASPGGPTAVFQNPAGLVLNSDLDVTVQGGASNGFNDPVLRAGLIGAGPAYGVTGGISQTTTSPRTTSAFYGLGVSAIGSGFSFGLAGQTGISNSSGTQVNAGLLYSGSVPLQFGFTAFGINHNISEWGAGFANDFGLMALVLDGAYNTTSKRLGLKPGARVGDSNAALTLSYGFVDSVNTIQLSDGFTAGGSLKAGARASVQIYYNEFTKFYGALTLAF